MFRTTKRWSASARLAGVSYGSVRDLMRRDTALVRAVEEAKRFYDESLLAEFHRRVVEGWVEPIFNARGEMVGETRRYSEGSPCRAIEWVPGLHGGRTPPWEGRSRSSSSDAHSFPQDPGTLQTAVRSIKTIAALPLQCVAR